MMPEGAREKNFFAPKRIILLSDGIRGHRHQASGIAQWLGRLAGVSVTEVSVPQLSGLKRYRHLKWGARRLPNATPEESRAWLCRLDFPIDALAVPPSSLFISAGSSAAPFCLALAKALKGRSAVVMTPSLGTKGFDFAIVPEHDRPAPASNILTTLGAPNHIYRPALHEAGQELLKTLPPLPRRVLALLIGGGDANYRINPAWAERTLPPLLEAAESSKTALLVTTSRRTGEEAEAAIEAILRPSPATRFLLLASRDESNPLPALLGLATHVLCTDDSVSMVSESVTAGFRVGLLRAGRKRGVLPLLKKRLGLGTARFDDLFASFARRNALEDLGEAPAPSLLRAFLAAETQRSDVPLDEARRAAEWILERWAIGNPARQEATQG